MLKLKLKKFVRRVHRIAQLLKPKYTQLNSDVCDDTQEETRMPKDAEVPYNLGMRYWRGRGMPRFDKKFALF